MSVEGVSIASWEVIVDRLIRSGKICLVAALGLSAATLGEVAPAGAQDAASMGCQELWYARNAIYARNGYCFRTQQAISAFGRGCFPPFGRLFGYEAQRVQELQYWERVKGC
ncbi:YARHG domain-containing protein [Rhizobiales bacterium GAS191]|nr:YARHG domain-containing protein [Rhizobiales bacterium GAS113]SED27822.1 YARHG domain-containing protein [Rhizobiales bacterium GAS191]